MEFIYKKIAEILKEDQRSALCTIVSTKGSAPLHAGSKMIVFETGQIIGTVGGGRLEFAVIQHALEVISEGKGALIHHDLIRDHQMCCGGQVDIYIEPIMKNKKLFMFGAGHVGKAVAKHCLDLDMDIFVVDDRNEIFDDWTFTGYHKIIGNYPEILPDLPFDNSSFIVIATYDHDTDREILKFCIKKPHAYLGMIGSKSKVEKTKTLFLKADICTDEELSAVDMPIGLDIHADTADEIAISIVAKLIKEKNK